MHDRTLTPEEAVDLIEERVQEFGLDALPLVHVREQPGGMWRIEWGGFSRIEAPMTLPQWERWLERHVGPISPERLASTEG